MSMTDWAKREVEIACWRERACIGKDSFSEYACACYESALKAFNCLMGDGHSGMSIGITKQILFRLIDGKPLTPIEDTDDAWEERHSIRHDLVTIVTTYQCKRMSSLFKDVHDDGTVTYHDTDRVVCRNIENPSISYHWGVASRLVDEMYPITMPYVPYDKPYVVACKDFLFDEKNGDFDTVAILHIVKPDSEVVEINRYFKESDDGFVEIEVGEYCERYKNRVRRNENESTNP